MTLVSKVELPVWVKLVIRWYGDDGVPLSETVEGVLSSVKHVELPLREIHKGYSVDDSYSLFVIDGLRVAASEYTIEWRPLGVDEKIPEC